MADTPGFSSFDITTLNPSLLQSYYSEFADFAGGCRFKGCCHISEPGCSVKAAVEAGEISAGRYSRYAELYKALKKAFDMRYKK